MSNTKGSMLISNADAVGTELVNQLGGTGYKPTEWSDAINLLGIKSADIPTALAGITPGSYSGSERGSIKYTTGNAVGAMLNKKYNTNRGFKPVEWEDAISKLTPLPENTVSGDICNIQDGADEVPLKSWEVTLPASLDGYSEIDVVSAGVNLWDEEWEDGLISASDGQNTPSDQYSRTKNYITVKPSISVYLFLGVTRLYIRRYGKDKGYLGYAQINTSSVWNVPSDTYFIRFCWDGTTYTDNISVNYPSTETAYNSANNPTTYTASLGRTIYGGTADVVNGTGQETHQEIDLGSLTWVYASASSRFYANLNLVGIYTNFPTNTNEIADITCADYETITFSSLSGDTSLNNKVAGVTTDAPFITIRDTRFSNANDFKNAVTGKKAVIPLATATDFTFTPITPTPETALGVNNFWADNGSSEITYHQDLDLITE